MGSSMLTLPVCFVPLLFCVAARQSLDVQAALRTVQCCVSFPTRTRAVNMLTWRSRITQESAKSRVILNKVMTPTPLCFLSVPGDIPVPCGKDASSVETSVQELSLSNLTNN